MNSHRFMYLALSITICCWVIPAEKIVSQEVQSPNKFVVEWAESFVDNNPKRLLSFYEQSDRLDVRMSSGVRYQGYKKLKEIYELDLKEVSFLRSTAKKIDVRELDKVAIVSFEHHYLFQVKRDRVKVAAHIQTVMVLNRAKSGWQIINEHSSPIADIPRFRELEEHEEDK